MKLLVDTDCGVDDAEALLLALHSPDLRLAGITTVGGNTTLPNVLGNVLRVLDLAHQPDVPVVRGSGLTLLGEALGRGADHVHGSDGFGGLAASLPVDVGRVRTDVTAAEWLVARARAERGQLTLVALGPLTNVALAATLDPDFLANLRRLYVMGGNFRGQGNVTAAAEFNFWCDPEAAAAVFSAAARLQTRLHLVPWETCRFNSNVPWDFFDAQLGREGRRAAFLRDFLAHTLLYKRASPEGYYSCDLLAALAALEPDSVAEAEDHFVQVECSGALTRGQCVVHTDSSTHKPNATIVKRFHTDHLLKAYRVLFGGE